MITELMNELLVLAQMKPALVERCRENQDLGPLVAEALYELSQRHHQPGDRAAKPSHKEPAVSSEAALVLVKRFGTLREAEAASGISRSALSRALRREGGPL